MESVTNMFKVTVCMVNCEGAFVMKLDPHLLVVGVSSVVTLSRIFTPILRNCPVVA